MPPRFDSLLIVALLCLFAGALLFFLDGKFALPLMGPGAVLVGCAFLLGGIDSVFRRRHVSGESQGSSKIVYRGVGAIFWGLSFLLIGFAVIAAGLVETFGALDRVLTLLRERPGAPMLWGGLLLVAIGGGLRAPWRRADGSAPPGFTLLPGRIGGTFLILLGLFIVALGSYEVMFPEDFDAALQALLNTIPTPPPLPARP